jgi:hypothetical protein
MRLIRYADDLPLTFGSHADAEPQIRRQHSQLLLRQSNCESSDAASDRDKLPSRHLRPAVRVFRRLRVVGRIGVVF